MTYSLRRESDGAGDSGPMSVALDWNTGESHGDRPKLGCYMKVGSIFGRMYSSQDFWMTTNVVEILEESENRVRFKTRNSTYIWEKF